MAVETMLMLHLADTDMAKAKAFSVETFPSVQEKEGLGQSHCAVSLRHSVEVFNATSKNRQEGR
jgi:hypothetical protein